MPHIASTLTNDTRYTEWNRGGDGRLIEGHSVTVKGGYGLANKNFVTPEGAVLTEVSDADLAFLEADAHFQKHMQEGFVRVLNRKMAAEKAEDGMTRGDKSQPLNPSMFSGRDPNAPETLSVNTGAR